MLTIRTPVFCFGLTKALADLEKGVTHFTSNLQATFAVVVIKIIGRCLTMRTPGCWRDLQAVFTMFDRFKRMAVGFDVLY
jgi:hypothetical protein